jgi:plasmid stability protein
MCGTCDHVQRMSVMIQIRNVPEDLHRKLKAKAALAGRSLSDYLLEAVRKAADQPTLDELRARIASLPPVKLTESPADIIRAERDR